MEHPGLPVGWARALYQQSSRAGHSHDQSAPENLRLLPHTERGPDFLSHPQLPEHLSQTRPQPLAGAPERRQWRAFHPVSTSRWTLRPDQLLFLHILRSFRPKNFGGLYHSELSPLSKQPVFGEGVSNAFEKIRPNTICSCSTASRLPRNLMFPDGGNPPGLPTRANETNLRSLWKKL